MLPEINSIKSRRQRIGLKQKELAKEAGISQSLIAKLESQKIEVSYSIAKNIFIALDRLENKNEKTCFDIMTKSLISIKRKDEINKASIIMKKNFISQLPVMENGKVLGSISESSIFEHLINGEDKDSLLKKSVESIMVEPFPIINKNTPISIAIPLLKTSGAILISEKDKIIGIITKSDII